MKREKNQGLNTTDRQSKYSLLKKFLHTKLGAKIGFYIGMSGFNKVDITIIRANGSIEGIQPSFNSRVDKGAALCASLIAGSALGGISSPLPPLYIALSTSVLTPAKSDTTLSGETGVSGLSRAIGSAGTYVAPSTLDGGASYVISKTFTSGVAGPTVIQSAGLFDAVSSGNLFVEANLGSSASLLINDQLVLTWTINL